MIHIVDVKAVCYLEDSPMVVQLRQAVDLLDQAHDAYFAGQSTELALAIDKFLEPYRAISQERRIDESSLEKPS